MPCCGGGKSKTGKSKTSNVANDKFSSFSGACYTGNLDKMKEHMKKMNDKDKKAVVDSVNEDGMSALHRAAQSGKADVVKFLCDSGGDPRLQSKKTGETPLHIATFHHNKNAVAELLNSAAKADVNVQDQHGYTPLLIAVHRGAADVVEQLLAAGANCNIKDNYGQDAIEMAKFLSSQESQGLSSPRSEHRKTYNLIAQANGLPSDPDAA